MIRIFLALSLSIVTFASTAQTRGIEEGHALAKETLKTLDKLQPFALEGNGLADLQGALPQSMFLRPLRKNVDRWPTMFDPEYKTWGKYMYCADAARALLVLGEAQNSRISGTQIEKHKEFYKRQHGHCVKYAHFTPEQAAD